VIISETAKPAPDQPRVAIAEIAGLIRASAGVRREFHQRIPVRWPH